MSYIHFLRRPLTNPRSFMAFLHDVIVSAFVWWFAYLLRFNFDIPPHYTNSMWASFVWVLPVEVLGFFVFGLYEGMWRFASLPDMKRILKAVSISGLVTVSLLVMVRPFGVVPRSVLILNPMLLILLMGGSRFAYRAWKEHRLYGYSLMRGQPVVLVGAGELAVSLLKDLSRSEQWRVVGLVDDDKLMQGRLLAGVRVLGDINQLAEVSAKLNAAHIIIALPSAQHEQRRKAISIASANNITALTLPAVDDLISGKVNVSQIRKVEVEDLLGREPVQLDTAGLQGLIAHKPVLVTGAGGSIGSELCRQIIKYRPSALVCVDVSEYALYRIEQELSEHLENEQITLFYVTADVKNAKRMKALLKLHKPSVVFHAAAYKHVPLMENTNVAEALLNNVQGTYTLANACKEANIEKFVLISTDKAVNPTNVMGASKRLAEMVCQGLQDTEGTKFVIVRFGNVLGSSGSVIPKFREQIRAGGPVTVTHPEITRYFMSIPEAAQLVMQAGLMGKGAEIFVLDMGEPVKIALLAKDMIRLSGLHEDEIEIVYTGLRPGEKLYEELLADDEHTLPTPHHKLRIAMARSADMLWVKKLIKWVDEMQQTDELIIKEQLKNWVEEYTMDTNLLQNNVISYSTTIH